MSAPALARRSVLFAGLAAAGLAIARPPNASAAPALLVENVSRLYPVRVERIAAPTDVAGIARALASWPGQVAVGGGRFSMGGQTAIEGGLHIDMRGMNALVWLDPQRPAVRVQAGMRWRDLQEHLDPLDLSVRTMQSYANFTVGGSVSVNAHGRYVGHGPIGASVRALRLVLADGQVVEADRHVNADLFRAAIGGYGAVGVIAEVELDLDRNCRIEREVAYVRLADYPGHFNRRVKSAPDCLLHNADLLPPAFDRASAVSWRSTAKPVTVPDRLVPRGADYALDRRLIWAATELPGGDRLQRKVRPKMEREKLVVWRNHEASLDTASLEPNSRESSTYALQEYFVPVGAFEAFAREAAGLIRAHEARVLNISVRHSPRDTDSVLAWAREEVFCFVLYYKQGTAPGDRERTARWTRDMIAAALKHGGTYYLPYQLHATQAQFDAAYPGKRAFRAIKARVDPRNRFSNELWKRYL
jgi:FAD/FMN-containing dehydrogenase